MTAALRSLALMGRKELVFAYRKENDESAQQAQINLRLSSKGYRAMAQYRDRIRSLVQPMADQHNR